ncbi:MAG TPA: TMEM165/GDT1 family protein [Steroidobacteraceae bacterium]|jgi:putative Ca2+/H+ antiporter (TMEM165/GDT1 family)|nr:TMEM165/GDT1 family protein [Steroidobacteraceae bacterium]
MEAFLISAGVVALAAEYSSIVAVVAGTTVGMMLANVPAVLFGLNIGLR